MLDGGTQLSSNKKKINFAKIIIIFKFFGVSIHTKTLIPIS